MTARLLLDTHILVRWLEKSARLSKDQLRVLRNVARDSEPVAISAMTLVELAQLASLPITRKDFHFDSVLKKVESSPGIEIVPIGVEIVRDVAALLPVLRDPADSVIVATARIHGLLLLTSDQRIIDSKLASVIG